MTSLIETCSDALARQGWAVASTDLAVPLAEIATSLGRPAPNRTGDVEKVLSPKKAGEAKSGSMSASYGLGAFPFHSDTAHWASPARFVLLRARANPDGVATRLLDTRAFLARLATTKPAYIDLNDLRTGVWRTLNINTPFVCSVLSTWRRVHAIRWDPCCMTPVGPRAEGIHGWWEKTLAVLKPEAYSSVSLKPGEVLVIDNRRVLHARDPVPEGTASDRALERVVVGEK